MVGRGETGTLCAGTRVRTPATQSDRRLRRRARRRGIGVDRIMVDEGEPIPDWRAYDFLVVMGAGANVWDTEASLDRGRGARRSARRCSPACRTSACASAPSCSRRPSARTTTAGWRPSWGSTRSFSRRPRAATRCSAASRPTSTCASGTPTTSRSRRARSGWPGRRATRTRRSGSAASPTGSSATSRRRARTSRPGSSCSRHTVGLFETRHGAGSLPAFLDDYGAFVPRLRETARQLFGRWLENALALGNLAGTARACGLRSRETVEPGARADRARWRAGPDRARARPRRARAAAR